METIARLTVRLDEFHVSGHGSELLGAHLRDDGGHVHLMGKDGGTTVVQEGRPHLERVKDCNIGVAILVHLENRLFGGRDGYSLLPGCSRVLFFLIILSASILFGIALLVSTRLPMLISTIIVATVF